MESRGAEDSKNVKTSRAYFFEGFISFFEDFSLTNSNTWSVECGVLNVCHKMKIVIQIVIQCKPGIWLIWFFGTLTHGSHPGCTPVSRSAYSCPYKTTRWAGSSPWRGTTAECQTWCCGWEEVILVKNKRKFVWVQSLCSLLQLYYNW